MLKHLLSLLYLIFYSFSLAVSQNSPWIWQNPLPGEKFNCMAFSDSTHGWIGGTHGMFLNTEDGGQSWNVLSRIVDGSIYELFFMNENVGWGVYESGLIHTSDGGQNWEVQPKPWGLLEYAKIFFASENIGYLLDLDMLWKTIDGGVSWNFIYTFTSTSSLDRFHFMSPDTGLLTCDDGMVLRTTDGGYSWNAYPAIQSLYITDIFFIDNQTGWVVGDDEHIAKTTDGGLTWNTQHSGFLSDPFRCVYFINPDTGWVAGIGPNMMVTYDGGQNWTTINSSPHNIFSLIFLDSVTGLALGNGLSSLYLTTDGGMSWSLKYKGLRRSLLDVQAIDNQTVWIVGADGAVLKTANGGDIWELQSVPVGSNLYSIYFSDQDHGWIAGGAGHLLYTNDAGFSWQQATAGNWDLYSIDFTSGQTGWVVGQNGNIFKTTDGGVNWIPQISGVSAPLYNVDFIDSLKGFAVGRQGILLKTGDGGQNWTQINISTTEDLLDIQFVNDSRGWLSGSSAYACYTVNGGNSWSALYPPLSYIYDWSAVYFIDMQNGWLGGAEWFGTNGLILRTKDYGSSWELSYKAPASLQSLSFVSADTGWAVGAEGMILKTCTGGIIGLDEKLNRSNLTGSFEVYQNFPNPFNSTTQISYALSQTSAVRIDIFDITGRHITTLADEKKLPGEYQTVWAGVDNEGQVVASGLYLCRIQAGQYVKTVKLLLVK